MSVYVYTYLRILAMKTRSQMYKFVNISFQSIPWHLSQFKKKERKKLFLLIWR